MRHRGSHYPNTSFGSLVNLLADFLLYVLRDVVKVVHKYRAITVSDFPDDLRQAPIGERSSLDRRCVLLPISLRLLPLLERPMERRFYHQRLRLLPSKSPSQSFRFVDRVLPSSLEPSTIMHRQIG